VLFNNSNKPVFYINGTRIDYANQWPHLGHIISCDLNDKHDIIRGHTALISQINNALRFFRNLDSMTKMRLIISYCYSLYRCTIIVILRIPVLNKYAVLGELVCVEFGAYLTPHIMHFYH